MLAGTSWAYQNMSCQAGGQKSRFQKMFESLEILVSNSFLFLVVRPGAPSSVLPASSDARSP